MRVLSLLCVLSHVYLALGASVGAGAGESRLRLKRAISYESETPIPCVVGCNAALDNVNACVESSALSSPECTFACTQPSYNLTIQCLECNLVHSGPDTLSALQRILDDLDSVCQEVNAGLTPAGGFTGLPTATGPFSTSTTGDTLTLEIWTGLTAYVSATGGSNPSGVISETESASGEEETTTNTRALPTVVSTPSQSGSGSGPTSSRTSTSGGSSSAPSASASATGPAAAPNAAVPANSVGFWVHALLGIPLIPILLLAL